MKLLRVAVLEDDKIFLKELVDNLKITELVTIDVKGQEVATFIEQVRMKQPEALLLDIHLGGSMNGIQVAEILKLPVLFLSAERKNYLESIDALKIDSDFPVEEIGKTPDANKLKKILQGFIPRVREYQKTQKIKVKPVGEDEILISPSDVSFIFATNKNHKIYFSNRKPIEVADKTFKYFRENGFPENKFYLFNRSYLLNISLTTYEDKFLSASYVSDKGETKEEKKEVPADKNKEIKKIFLK